MRQNKKPLLREAWGKINIGQNQYSVKINIRIASDYGVGLAGRDAVVSAGVGVPAMKKL
jgi:hypothetical protein